MHDPRHDRLHDEMPEHPFPLPEHRDAFLRLVREHLGRGGADVRIRGGTATVTGSAGRIGLDNLAQMCSLAPPIEWPRIIGEHLDKSDDALARALALDLVDGSFEQLAGKLAVRLHAGDYLPRRLAPHIVHRCDLPGTVTVLVADLGPSVAAVPTGVAAAWGVPPEQLFTRGLQNVRALGPPDWHTLPLPPDLRLDVLICPHFYTATHALLLNGALPRPARHGHLIAVPHRGALLCFAVDGAGVLAAMEGLLIMAGGMYREGPGSISPHVYWRNQEGRFEQQQSLTLGRRVRFAPSAGFAAVLDQVRAAGP
jgi:hypothetical protein